MIKHLKPGGFIFKIKYKNKPAGIEDGSVNHTNIVLHLFNQKRLQRLSNYAAAEHLWCV